MRWHFARTPKWVVRHVVVVLLVVAMVWAGFWQLRRLDEKRDHRDVVEARQEEPVADVRAVVPGDAEVGAEAIEDALYRPVSATGRYLDGDTVVVQNRTYNGAAGGWVLTPLLLDDGTAVVVNRGFLGLDRDGEITPPPAPAGEVRVQGLVFPSQRRGSFGPRDPEEGTLDVLARADIERIDEQVDPELLPAYIQAERSEPAEAAPSPDAPQLVLLDPPEADLGPHLGYAVQWFIFATIAVIGYGALLRKVAGDRSDEPPEVASDEIDRELEALIRTER